MALGIFWFCMLFPIPCFVGLTHFIFRMTVVADAAFAVYSKSSNISRILASLNNQMCLLSWNERCTCSLLKAQPIYANIPTNRLSIGMERNTK
jgi:hypothetical protein